MFKTAVLAGLVLLDDIKPKPVPRAEKYITDRVPMLSVVEDGFVPTKAKANYKPSPTAPRKPRKKHVCGWSDQQVWAVFFLGAILGGFLIHCIS